MSIHIKINTTVYFVQDVCHNHKHTHSYTKPTTVKNPLPFNSHVRNKSTKTNNTFQNYLRHKLNPPFLEQKSYNLQIQNNNNKYFILMKNT